MLRVFRVGMLTLEGRSKGFLGHITFETGDFPGGAVVKNPPANAGDKGLIPGPGRSHMLQSY